MLFIFTSLFRICDPKAMVRRFAIPNDQPQSITSLFLPQKTINSLSSKKNRYLLTDKPGNNMMHYIKHILLSLSLFAALSVKAQQGPSHMEGELEWYTDLLTANDLSKAQHKPVFAFFTGSDWCGWCRKLHIEVFEKPEFIKWAKKYVILLELDFPHSKPLPQPLAEQNNSLQQAFQVRGYPTVWLFFMNKNADSATYGISPLGSLGYPTGAVQGKEELKFLSDANALLAKVTAK